MVDGATPDHQAVLAVLEERVVRRRRVEAVVPIQDPKLAERLEWLLQLYANDNVSAWTLAADGTYQRQRPTDTPLAAQEELIEVWSSL